MTVYQETVQSESAPLRKLTESVSVRGRYAPSPTGEAHLGNASTALVAWLSARTQRGRFVLRMEDLDRPRVRPGAAEAILRDLDWLGLDWDEGPDTGGPYAPYLQSERGGLYEEAFRKLRDDGRVYPCFCSRKDVARAASAPQAPGDELRYPGICRELDPSTVERRLRDGERHAWRFRLTGEEEVVFTDRVRGVRGLDEPLPGDFVVRRSDGVAAYHLAVVVDDAAMRVSEVVRGDDLLPSTTRQLLLYEALGRTPPCHAHVPLLLGSDGVRLSKRHRGVTLRELREHDLSAEEVVGHLARLLGLRPTSEPVRPVDLVDDFSWEDVVDAPDGLVVDPTAWPPA